MCIEYAGEAIRALSMEGRMTVCNMSIEGGARAGLIAPDEKTYAYLKGRPKAPKGDGLGRGGALLGDAAVRRRRAFRHARSGSMPRSCRRIVTWGTSPEDVVSVTGTVPDPDRTSPTRTSACRSGARSNIWACKPGTKITDIKLDRVFIGSCTNGRIEDLRAVAKIVEGKTVNANVNAMVVPGSGLVKEQAEAEGLDKIFKAAGFEWREPGCSMCLAMNAGPARAGRALRLDLEPQFRGPSGLQGPHPSGVAGHGGGGGDRRALRRRARVALSLLDRR